MPEEQRWALTAVQGVEEYFDWQRLRHEVLEPLRAGRPARYRPFSWLPGRGLDERWVRVEPAPIIVREGVSTARPPVEGSRRPGRFWWRRRLRNATAD
jgi:uridine kinase